MPFRPSRSWTKAIRDLRADRPPAAERMAHLALQHSAKIEAIRAEGGARKRLWTTAGGFDRRAIMLFAHANRRFSSMAEALTHAWACAHAARRAGSH